MPILIGLVDGLYEDSPTEELLEFMEKSVNVYSSELKRFLSFMRYSFYLNLTSIILFSIVSLFWVLLQFFQGLQFVS
jgi:hypothetical protein